MTLEELYHLLSSSHVQIQGIVDTLYEPVVILDTNFYVLAANHAFYQTFRAERADTIGQSLFDLGNGQWDIPDLRTLLGEVVPKSAAILGFQVTHDFPDLGGRTMLVSARQLSQPGSNSNQMLVQFEDVTTRQKADAAKDILVAETRHRMKNVMAMLRAVASRAQTDGLSAKQYQETFMGRLETIFNAQEFISSNCDKADVAAVIKQAIPPMAVSRVAVVPGPHVYLTQYQVMPISMMLHEMLTNATKYGAISNSTGVVHLDWSTEQRDGRSVLLLDWREEGGPPVSPSNHRGFGTELIDYSTKLEGGEAVRHFDPSGLRLQISLPLAFQK